MWRCGLYMCWWHNSKHILSQASNVYEELHNMAIHLRTSKLLQPQVIIIIYSFCMNIHKNGDALDVEVIHVLVETGSSVRQLKGEKHFCVYDCWPEACCS